MQASKFCEDHAIILYLLPPNTTHILQPADVGAFKSLKDYWRQELIDYQRENPNCVVKRRNVAPLLSKVLEKIPVSSITNEFGATGLYPLNADAVDYSKCLEIVVENEEGEVTEMGKLQGYEIALRVGDHILVEENALKCKNEEGNLEVFRKMYKTLTTKAVQQKKHNSSRTII